jgi:hypothetical protein
MIQAFPGQDGSPREDHPIAHSPRDGDPERGKANTVTSEAVSGMASLVCDRLFGMIDHDNVNRATLRVELETQLFLQGSEDRR